MHIGARPSEPGRARLSALFLLVPRIRADDAKHSLPLDELALDATLLDGRFYFHGMMPSIAVLEYIRI